jgi:hypothetical protein
MYDKKIIIKAHVDQVDTRSQPRTVPSTIIKTSSIQNAGLGIFAGESIKSGTHMGWYYGKTYIKHPLNDSHYILSVHMKPGWVSPDVWAAIDKKEGLFIDGNPDIEPSEIEKYKFGRLNHAADGLQNVKFLSNGRIVTLRNIHKGEELFIDYGMEFFDE